MLGMMQKLLVRMFLVVAISLSVGACFANQTEEYIMHPLYPSLTQLQNEFPNLDLSKESVPTPSFEAYRDYYHLNFPEIEHRWGLFRSGAYRLLAHVFIPQNPRATVFLAHGYLDHTGMLYNLIENCLDQQFIVAVYDLPGHGLSDGERASIRNFDEYVESFRDFFDYCQEYLPSPYHVISHSTGSSIVLEFLTQTDDQPFGGIVFLAPLVRYAYWHLSKFGYALGKPLHLKAIPRRSSPPSSDPVFREFAETDPLQISRVPLRWVGAMHEWNDDIREMDVLSLPLLIIQGTEDSVVDWDFNIPFLQEKIRGVTVELIEEADHQLTNERQTFRTEVFRHINEFLEKHS